MRLGAILRLAAAAAAVLAATASGGRAFNETIHYEGEFAVEGFCDVQGLTVEIAFVLDLRVHAVPHGRDRLVYFLQHGERTETLRANGRTLTSRALVTERDLRVTDNGDGTLTVLVLATGNATLYGEDGTAIARNPGQIRFELLVADGGTPGDPSDDEILEVLGLVKGSTGRTDDFCEAAVAALA